MTEPSFERQNIPVLGRQVSYWRTGSTEVGAPRLLFIHGVGASSHIWEGLARTLADRHHLIALDLPGVGGSESQGVMTPTAQAAFASDFLDALQIPRVDIALGHSLGGTIALELALHNAAKLSGLMVLNAAPTLPWLPRIVLKNPLARRLSRLPSANVSNPILVRLYLSMIFGDASRVTAEIVDGYARVAAAPEYSARMSEQMEGLARHRRRGVDLRAIAVPASIVWGDKDPLFPKRQASVLANAIPNAALHRLPTVGHCPPQEAPELVAELVRELLTRVGRRLG